MVDKAPLFFGEKSKLQPMSSSLENNEFLFGMLYINLLILKGLFGFEVPSNDVLEF